MDIISTLRNFTVTGSNLAEFLELAIGFDWAAAHDQHDRAEGPYCNLEEAVAGVYWYCRQGKEANHAKLCRVLEQVYSPEYFEDAIKDPTALAWNDVYTMLCEAGKRTRPY